jgi:serine protease DegQ
LQFVAQHHPGYHLVRRLWLVFSQAVTVALAVLFVVGTLKPQWITHAPAITQPDVVAIRTAAPPTSVPALSAGSLSTAVHRAAPAVVSVNATKLGVRNPHETDPWYRYFFGDRSPGDVQRGVGSGVIVSPQGYLLTNNHVVEGANEIEVRLPDGREAKARLVGTDPDTDVAVLKVDIDKLPAITLGDVESLQVGDLVLAIGNPFNVGQTVTSGIVSALGRNQLGLSTFENFIQTDAAINPGNSGGALVDVNGQLVGINTAIFSRSGGSMGIGFAIPVDLARQVMEGLIKEGKVTRGWIGVEPRDLPAEYAESFKLPIKDGVLIAGVLQDGPAGKSGLKPGDVVIAVGERPVTNTVQLLNAVAALKPGSEATLGVQRGAQALHVKLTVGQRPPAQRRPPQ